MTWYLFKNIAKIANLISITFSRTILNCFQEQSQVIGPLSATLSLTVSSDETDRSRIFSASNPRRSIATPSTETAVYRGNSFASAIIVKSRNSFTNTNGANTRNSFTRTTSLIRRNSFGKTETDNNYYMNAYTRNSFSKTSARSKMGCRFSLQRSPSLDQSDINTAHNNMHISSAYHGWVFTYFPSMSMLFLKFWISSLCWISKWEFVVFLMVTYDN